MISSIEDMPTEIWLLIFSYLEGHDLFAAFTNLNNSFNRLISSRYLSYKIQFNKNNSSSLISLIHCSSNQIFNRIISLEWIAKPQFGYLPQLINKNLSQLTRLKSFKIEIHPRQTLIISKILEQLPSLENVSLKCKDIQPLLIKILFNLSSLRTCQLINSSSVKNVLCHFDQESLIEKLYLTNLSISIESKINSVFDYLPNLKKLEICGTENTFKNLTNKISNEILMFERIPITKIKCQSNRNTLVFFEQIEPVMSLIKHFSLSIYIDINDQILLERLINQWWGFIQHIEQISILIKVSKHIDQADQNKRKKFLDYQQILLDKKPFDQTNKHFQMKWIQTEVPRYKFIAQIGTTESNF